MFMQVIQGHVRDADALMQRATMWRDELMPKAEGFLGSTIGVTPDGMGVMIARFESEHDARANSDTPHQSAWWRDTKDVFDGEVEFIDCPDCDTMMGGGSDDAHFVQLIECRVKDRESMREMGRAMEAELRQSRPDIIGGVVGWKDDHECVQVMYFADEDAARAGERRMTDDPSAAQWTDMLDGQPRFLDLRDPMFT
ncbi:MAG TPA: hypothetical protein VFL59_16005 [Candidatus Nanopelagicales bacterium]|nr:hypothetical protein [Candidatus Nanopelagicales bacterium]